MSPAEGKVRVWVQFQPGQRAQVEQALNGVGSEVHYVFEDLNAFAVSVPAAALTGLDLERPDDGDRRLQGRPSR